MLMTGSTTKLKTVNSATQADWKTLRVEVCTRLQWIKLVMLVSSSTPLTQVRSWGVNDSAALGRVTANVPDPKNAGEKIPNDELESYPFIVESLKEQGFRAVRVFAGDSVSIALSDTGDLRAWGSFRVSL